MCSLPHAHHLVGAPIIFLFPRLAFMAAMAQPTSFQNSATGTRTRVARVRAEYPNQLDYSGVDDVDDHDDDDDDDDGLADDHGDGSGDDDDEADNGDDSAMF